MPLFLADLLPQSVRSARSVERREVRTAAQCRRGTLRETVEVLNLSTAGARVRALAPLRAGHAVWTKGCESGCVFVHPLHPAVLDSLIATRMAAKGG